MKKKLFIIILSVVFAVIALWKVSKKVNLNIWYTVGQPIDSLNNVRVYYNGGVDNVEGRNTVDGYNLGLKNQCVEFVKRYYYEHYNHRMPDTYGHAKDFFDQNLEDGQLNKQRDLWQFRNPGNSKPMEGDLIVMRGTIFNPYGHVAIISAVNDENIQIIQQNPGAFSSSREWYKLEGRDSIWHVQNDRIMGWLRK